MKRFNFHSLSLCLLLVTLLASCRDDKNDPTPNPVPTAERKGLFVLAEGSFNGNNSSLTYYDFESTQAVADQFSSQNGRGLGDTANDVVVYGSKMYIVVNGSSTVEVVNARTAKSLKQIDMKNNGVARQPRYIVFNKNKGYISSYDGTVAVLDTASLTIEKYITVGRNPEQMAIANGKLYVANSGGLDFPNYDKTVSVIDLTTLTETKKITVVLNPQTVKADQYGDIYVLSTGNYADVNSSLAIIDSKTDAVKSARDFTGGDMAIKGDSAYITEYTGAIKLYNVKTETVIKDNFVSDGTSFTSVYGVAVDELSGEVFVTDAKNYVSNGTVTCFAKDGTRKYSIPTGISPKKVVFINK